MGFKDNFVWGVATASYQVEGGAFEGGRGLSVWDTFAATEGKIIDGSSGEIACDQIHRYKEDIAIMKELGVKAYRFSISWPRVIPDGTGEVSEEGLTYYDNLINELLANDIEPYVTLFHWDFPYELYKKGGWLNRDVSDWFAEYTKVIVERYSDRVKYWMTENEPNAYIYAGHYAGVHAPGLNYSPKEVLTVLHHSLMAHGKAVQTIRKYTRQKAYVGIAQVADYGIPYTDSSEDVAAAREYMFECGPEFKITMAMHTDPMILGKYPDSMYEKYGKEMSYVKEGDMEIICQPLDFLGLNIYTGARIQAGENGEPVEVKDSVGSRQTSLEWSVHPEGMYWIPKLMSERYGLPIYITENGMSNLDWVSRDGKVHDQQRIDFLESYLTELKRLASEGVDLQGYFQWSLMDNYEWSFGYTKRFGLVHVDYETQTRTIKESGYWYRKVIETNGKEL